MFKDRRAWHLLFGYIFLIKSSSLFLYYFISRVEFCDILFTFVKKRYTVLYLYIWQNIVF